MKTLASITLLSLSSLSMAQFGLNDLTYFTGAGSNRAALVVDFKNGGPSYVWGFQFNGTVTGQQMIEAIAADPVSGLSIQKTSFSFGDALTGISFKGNNVGGFNPGSTGYLAYYLADGSASAPTSWNSSSVGMGGRTVANNSWDGWSWAPNFVATAPSTNYVAAVPEPATLAILGLGVAALSRRRAKKN
jgi:hypothetical protein